MRLAKLDRRHAIVAAALLGLVAAAGAAKIARPQQPKAPPIIVGRKAPDFTAQAYYQGKTTTIKLSDFRGKWVVLCFYPADFTCV